MSDSGTIAVESIVWLVIGVAILGFIVLVNLNSLLSENAPIVADVLIVEGWLPDYALQAGIAEFQNGKY